MPSQDLTASYFTLTGSPLGEPPRNSLEARTGAAKRAGFTGMALAPDELIGAPGRGRSIEDLVAIFAEHELAVPELEPLRGWDGEPSEEAAAAERAIFDLADAFGAARVNAIQVVDPAQLPPELIAERFAAVCERAAAHGLTVAFEPRANSPVESPAAALELIAAAGAKNAGITLDAYHFHRAGLRLADLDGVPAEAVVAVQLNDMREQMQGTPIEDALEHRLAPGEGAIDLPAWLRGLRAHGIDAPFAVEVISRDFMQLPLDEAAERAAQGAREALAGLG